MLMGLETEYGLAVEGRGPEYLAAETAALLQALPFAHADRWDMGAESPLQDLRGRRAHRLAVDPKDARYDQQGPPAAFSANVKVERLLTNGARLYNDHGHPEYSTPECASPADLVAHDRAGERILLACAKAWQLEAGGEVRLYKNNTDFHGSSYGCHENYLLLRPQSPEKLLRNFLPFLVTRQIFTGAGKVGIEGEAQGKDGFFYQLSQRADFFSRLMGVDTLYRRPLLNTRDEPHADPSRYIRLHVIAGDANRSQFALALKMGTTALVLRLLAEGWAPPLELEDPLRALKEISRDQGIEWLVSLDNGRKTSAVEIQALHLEAARAHFSGLNDWVDWTLEAWEETLRALAGSPATLADRLDWPAKLLLLQTYLGDGGRPDLQTLQSIDLEYHNIDPQTGLFAPLEQSGQMQRIVSEAAIEEAMQAAPLDTRARIRGEALRRFGGQITALSWGRLRTAAGEIDLSGLVDGSLEELNRQLEGTPDLAAFAETVRRWEDGRSRA